MRWPERQLHTVRYDLEATYAGIYECIVGGIEKLELAHYNLESYKRAGIPRDEFEEGRQEALEGFALSSNYDRHWNPTRMVQRAGRIDRIGSTFDTIGIYNLFPDEGLERLLGIVERLSRKIAQIDAMGFLDASVLGETVHPPPAAAPLRHSP